MELLVGLILIIALGLAAIRWGFDSRPVLPDTANRRTAGDMPWRPDRDDAAPAETALSVTDMLLASPAPADPPETRQAA